MSDYWDECIETALEEVNIKASKEQIEEISGAVEVCHENYSMGHGQIDIGPSNSELEIRRLTKELNVQYPTRNIQIGSVLIILISPAEACVILSFVEGRG